MKTKVSFSPRSRDVRVIKTTATCQVLETSGDLPKVSEGAGRTKVSSEVPT